MRDRCRREPSEEVAWRPFRVVIDASAAGRSLLSRAVRERVELKACEHDLMEHDLDKLNILRQRGRESFAVREKELAEFLI
jgi:hypothetical protein